MTATFGWGFAIWELLREPLSGQDVDFFDVHVYGDDPKLVQCDDLRRFSRKTGRKIYLGEFGQSSKAFDDFVQMKITQGYLSEAKRCGLAGAFAWRLSDVRPGFNPEARFSYEAYGRLRPAFKTFQNFQP